MADPFSIIEIAKTLFSGISAVSASINIWKLTRNKTQASASFDKTFETTKQSREAVLAAEQLVAIIPVEVIEDLEKRADTCWKDYRDVLGGPYLPNEVDRATESVQACVCRQLNYIYVLNRTIPDRWKEQWKAYNCEERYNSPKTKSMD
ncbi:MAG: hypothetical protein ACJ748_10900 [Flavisolibacter sp.]